MIKILALNGSLRADSFNLKVLKLLELIIECDYQDKIHFKIGRPLDYFPLFNPDIENQFKNEFFDELVKQINESDLIIFSSPEYIHSIPGNLKNALDWIVGTGALDRKKAAIFLCSSSAGEFAFLELKEILNVLTANHLIENLNIRLSGVKTYFDTNSDKKRELEMILKNFISNVIAENNL